MLSRDTMALVETDSATLELCRIVEESDGGAPSLVPSSALDCRLLHRGHLFLVFSASEKACLLILMHLPSWYAGQLDKAKGHQPQ